MYDITSFIQSVDKVILNPLIILMFSLALLYFVYGVIRFLSLDAADKTRDEAKNAILWGIVGMFIMFSVYGIIKILLSTFGITSTDVGSPASQYIKFN